MYLVLVLSIGKLTDEDESARRSSPVFRSHQQI
jgi:hypothetical protein